MQNVIDDGYNEPGYVAAEERQHGELRFVYRPMLSEEVEATETAAAKEKPVKAVHLFAAQIVKHLVSWSEVDKDGNARPINIHVVRRLRPLLFNRVYRIICGLEASDLDPKASDEEQADFVDRVIAEAGGTRPAEELANAAKN